MLLYVLYSLLTVVQSAYIQDLSVEQKAAPHQTAAVCLFPGAALSDWRGLI